MENRPACSPEHVAAMGTDELRARFLVENLFTPGEVTLVHSHHDRVVVGGVQVAGREVALVAADALRADHFLQRREVGIVCVAGSGTVRAGGRSWDLPTGACLYLGRGIPDVVFAGDDARFYLVSTPAHAEFPAALVLPGEGTIKQLGDQEHTNRRTLNQYIHRDGVRSCQLVMGVTRLESGSVWNTMPAHTHDRRTEVYLYFDLAADARVIHLMGEPRNSRHLVVANEQAVISPSWSVHSGVGTSSYAFVWAMAGENQAFDDMDPCPVTDMR